MTKFYPIFMSNRMIHNMSEYCQAQPQLNSTQLQLKLSLRLALIPLSPATQPPGHPATHPPGPPPTRPPTRESISLSLFKHMDAHFLLIFI